MSLILGKERKNGEGQYVRHSGSSNVFLISEKISIKSEVQDWLNKDLMALNPKQISGLKIKFGEKHSISIIRGTNESKWESAIPKNNVPKNERINNALDRLSSLSFSKLLNQDYVTEELLESKEDTLIVSLFDGRVYTLKLQKYLQSNENYVLSLRMGILQDVSENIPSDSSDLHKDMKTFNQKMNGRFFEISSWEGKELILSDE